MKLHYNLSHVKMYEAGHKSAPTACARVSTEKGKEMGVALLHSSDAEASKV